MEMLKQRAGIDLTHVPYKGGGPASIAVISGENALMFGGTSVVSHIKNGKLKALAVTGSKGWPTMPDLPAIGEFYPGYKSSLWHGIFAPQRNAASHPRQAAHGVATPCLPTPEVKERLVTGGAGEPYITTPAEFAAVLRADYERYGTVIQSIGFKVDWAHQRPRVTTNQLSNSMTSRPQTLSVKKISPRSSLATSLVQGTSRPSAGFGMM